MFLIGVNMKYKILTGEDMLSVKSEKEINMIRGKLLVKKAKEDEIKDFLHYVDVLESLVEEASQEDFYGTEGWKHRIGWDE